LATEKFGGRTWPGDVLRLAMLMTHYREPIDFSIKRLEEAERMLTKWPAGLSPEGDVHTSVLEALGDDLNTVAAIQALHQLASTNAPEFAASAAQLGVLPAKAEVSDDLSQAVAALVAMRLELIKAKNWGEADKIRDDLLSKGIQLKDGKDPETGERVTTWEVKR
jgi:cysteinyl-tRNA synthetase